MTLEESDKSNKSLRARVYTIAPTRAFVDALAEGILDQYDDDPLTLSRVTVLLPTRRACRSLREAFLRTGDGRPMLLPDIRPIGDVEEDEILLTAHETSGHESGQGLGEKILDLPEAISGLRRELLLVQLILRFNEGRTTGGLDAAQAAHLARDLAALIDQVQTEGLDFANLVDIVPEQLASHWQLTLDFLRIVTDFWPKILAEENCVDPALRRNHLLELQAEAWRQFPPGHPVIAAGSTGSIPATAKLLRTIAHMPKGCVVLPGLDVYMSDEAWVAAREDATHPQYGMAHLLEVFGLQRPDVDDWHTKPEAKPDAESDAVVARAQLLNRALLPAEQTARWRESEQVTADALSGFSLLACAGPEEEARAIALMMREVLETPERRAVLVTPDRNLARRVAAELARWDIEIDDTAGQPLARTPVGIFLRLTATLAVSGLAPIDLLATLKHPLACGGQSPGAFRTRVRLLERLALRGPRPVGGFEGLKARVSHEARDDEDRALLGWLDHLAALQVTFAELIARPGAAMSDLLKAHVAFAEAMAADDQEQGPARLWTADDGEAAAGFIDELNAAGDVLPNVPGQLYPALLDGLMGGRIVRPRFGRHARLSILGLLEARLQHADLMILGGLNEGTWPPLVDTGPWLSRPMRRDFGLPQPERRIGLTAHDFVQAACGQQVVLTRSANVDGAPTVPARWLLRIQALLDGAKLSWPQAVDHLAWARQLDDPGHEARPVSAPAPRPPVDARPRELAVTDIETWVRDPYAIFARRILGLRALAEIDADAGAAEHGTFIHEALDEFVKNIAWPPAADACDELLRIGEDKFGAHLAQPAVRAFWWPRFERTAAWFVKTLNDAAASGQDKPLATEVSGKLEMPAPFAPFTLMAKADRLDHDSNGDLVLIDYKTGAAPTAKQVLAGYSPQLPLEGLIAQAGKFRGIKAGSVVAMEYWKISGRNPPGEIVPIKTKDNDITPEEILAVARKRLDDLVMTFDQPDTPYLSQPQPQWAQHFSDYELLARLGEWSHDDSEEDQDD